MAKTSVEDAKRVLKKNKKAKAKPAGSRRKARKPAVRKPTRAKK